VTPIRQEPAPPMAEEIESPAARSEAEPAAPGHGHGEAPRRAARAAAGPSAEDMASSGLPGFESPFEDELDTPAFLRRRSAGGGSDERDGSSFWRRSGQD